jgi:DNA polymerase-3 subunit delta'
VSYHFFVEHMIGHVMTMAKNTAFNGHTHKAAELAELSDKLTSHKLESDTYNLDRKQTLLTLFSMIEATQ